MMKYVMINCREATFLTSMKEEGKLSLVNKMKLAFHTSMCSFCRKFETQASAIGKESRHLHSEATLPDKAKERIRRSLNEGSR